MCMHARFLHAANCRHKPPRGSKKLLLSSFPPSNGPSCCSSRNPSNTILMFALTTATFSVNSFPEHGRRKRSTGEEEVKNELAAHRKEVKCESSTVPQTLNGMQPAPQKNTSRSGLSIAQGSPVIPSCCVFFLINAAASSSVISTKKPNPIATHTSDVSGTLAWQKKLLPRSTCVFNVPSVACTPRARLQGRVHRCTGVRMCGCVDSTLANDQPGSSAVLRRAGNDCTAARCNSTHCNAVHQQRLPRYDAVRCCQCSGGPYTRKLQARTYRCHLHRF